MFVVMECDFIVRFGKENDKKLVYGVCMIIGLFFVWFFLRCLC